MSETGPARDSSPDVPVRAPVPGSRRRARSVGLALGLLVALPIALALFQSSVRDRLSVVWLARGLRARDATARHEARRRLLDLGRPAIDSVYPELVASEVADERPTNLAHTTAVFVAHESPERFVGLPEAGLVVDEVVSDPIQKLAPGTIVAAPREIACPVAARLSRPGAKRVLLLLDVGKPIVSIGHAREDRLIVASFKGPVRVVVALDDELAPAILEAVREKLESAPRPQ